MALSTLVEEFNSAYVTAGASNESVVVAMYENVYGTAAANIPAGFVAWWVAQLESGAVTQATLVETSLNYVAASKFVSGDLTTAATAAKAAVDSGKTLAEVKAAAEQSTATPTTPSTSLDLTSGTDKLVGTSGNDTFEAGIAQNAFAGGVSNTLSSADKLDGGAGTDTLNAELVPEFFGVSGNNQIDVQPHTTNIEEVYVEARDFALNTPVIVDAKNMTDIDKIGSKFSDGDLVIENLTTLESIHC